MSEEIAVLRRCRKCRDWRSIDMFTPLGKLCQRCVRGKTATGYIGRMRGMVITDKGRATLRAMAAEEAAAA